MLHTVFVDSNILGSKTLYDWMFLLRIHSDGMFTLVTSPDVLDEAHRVWRRRYPEGGGASRDVRDERFREHFDNVVSDWTGGPAAGSDPHDAHVHNAAVHAGANILLTNNVKDFNSYDQLPYDIYTPDQFFCLINTNDPELVEAVARIQADYWLKRQKRHPERPFKRLSEALHLAGCTEFSGIVFGHVQRASGIPEDKIEQYRFKRLAEADTCAHEIQPCPCLVS